MSYLNKSASFTSNSYSMELLSKEDEKEEKGDGSSNEWKELFSLRYIFLWLYTTFSMAQNSFATDIVKIFSNSLGVDDKTFNFNYSFSSLTSSLGVALVAIKVYRLGVFNTLIAYQLCGVFIDLIIIFVIDKVPYLLIPFTHLIKINFNGHYQLNTIVLFSLYESETAIKLSKFHELTIFAGNLVMIQMNNLLYTYGDFSKIFTFYLLVNVLNICVVQYVLKGRWSLV